MANIKSLEADKRNILKNLDPVEMEAYIKKLISDLYEAFLLNDIETLKTSKELIEEATNVFKSEGYINSLSKELEFRLAKANEVLVETLDSKKEAEITLSKVIVENNYFNYISSLSYSINILETLIEGYSKEPSEVMLATIKEVAVIVENHLTGIRFFISDKDLAENVVYAEELDLLKKYYSTYEDLATKINGF